MCLPNRKDFHQDNILRLRSDTIYISRVKKLNDLKEKYKNLTTNTSVQEITDLTNIRMWKLESSISIEDFKTKLIENASVIKDSDDLIKLEGVSYLECK
jgi:hypothetical protein